MHNSQSRLAFLKRVQAREPFSSPGEREAEEEKEMEVEHSLGRHVLTLEGSTLCLETPVKQGEMQCVVCGQGLGS